VSARGVCTATEIDNPFLALRDLAGHRTGPADVLHDDVSNPGQAAIADLARGGCRSGPLLPDKLPIALNADGRTHAFLYPLTRNLPIDFRGFWNSTPSGSGPCPAWTVRLLVPCHKRDAMPRYEAAFYEHPASPLRPSLVENLRWYFHARRSPPKRSRSNSIRPSARLTRHASKRHIAGEWNEANPSWTPPCRRSWPTRCPHDGRLECYVLRHGYRHLFPLVGAA
jgi:hypothetical protein